MTHKRLEPGGGGLAMKDWICLAPECEEPGYSRGLCRGHIIMVNLMIREGEAEASDLIRRGLMLELYEGPHCNKGRRQEHNTRGIFLKGCEVRGKQRGRVGT